MAERKPEESKILLIDSSPPPETEVYRLQTRFGAAPVDEAPRGWEVETRRPETKVMTFEHAYLQDKENIARSLQDGQGGKGAHMLEMEAK